VGIKVQRQSLSIAKVGIREKQRGKRDNRGKIVTLSMTKAKINLITKIKKHLSAV
jgi:hypothetical protein